MNFVLFLSGDVMLGRGIDQILRYKNDPKIYESFVKDARHYVPQSMVTYTQPHRHVPDNYIWGDLVQEELYWLAILRIINLETSVTTSSKRTPKPVLYKMHPGNVGVILAAKIDYCHLANNHVLDWGQEGLVETMQTLTHAHINFGGIGFNQVEASQPRFFHRNNKRFVIFSYGDIDSGIPANWKATNQKIGVNVIDTHLFNTKKEVAEHISNFILPGDFIIVSIHWGSNWGYQVDPFHEEFAHYLIDHAKVDVIHGHSSHHFRPIEIYHGKLILYGCGDLVNDYEIIENPGRSHYLPEISLTYFPSYHQDKLTDLVIIPYTVSQMQLKNVSEEKTETIAEKLNVICQKYQIRFRRQQHYLLVDQ